MTSVRASTRYPLSTRSVHAGYRRADALTTACRVMEKGGHVRAISPVRSGVLFSAALRCLARSVIPIQPRDAPTRVRARGRSARSWCFPGSSSPFTGAKVARRTPSTRRCPSETPGRSAPSRSFHDRERRRILVLSFWAQACSFTRNPTKRPPSTAARPHDFRMGAASSPRRRHAGGFGTGAPALFAACL